LKVTGDSPATQAFIVYDGDYKTQIEGTIDMFKGEKVLVKQGAVDIVLDNI
jgi:hypothetical protein